MVITIFVIRISPTIFYNLELIMSPMIATITTVTMAIIPLSKPEFVPAGAMAPATVPSPGSPSIEARVHSSVPKKEPHGWGPGPGH